MKRRGLPRSNLALSSKIQGSNGSRWNTLCRTIYSLSSALPKPCSIVLRTELVKEISPHSRKPNWRLTLSSSRHRKRGSHPRLRTFSADYGGRLSRRLEVPSASRRGLPVSSANFSRTGGFSTSLKASFDLFFNAYFDLRSTNYPWGCDLWPANLLSASWACPRLSSPRKRKTAQRRRHRIQLRFSTNSTRTLPDTL